MLAEDPSGASIPAAYDPAACEIRSSVERGRLLAVCGLCGGAGASTLAYLVALAAARTHPGSVLVADTGGPTGGLSSYAGVEVSRSLAELSAQSAAGPRTALEVETSSDGVQVLAAGPRFTAECAAEGIKLLLDQARERYALTVIDCGTLASEVGQTVMDEATHIAWVLPATEHGVELGQRVLAAAPSGRGSQLLVARRDRRQTKAPVRELRRLAGEHRLPLVLVPDLCGLEDGNLPRAVDAAQVSVQAILGALRR